MESLIDHILGLENLESEQCWNTVSYPVSLAAVTLFLDSLFSYLPVDAVRTFFVSGLSEKVIYKDVEYHCAMNDERKVTELAIVALAGEHRYAPQSDVLLGVEELFHLRTDNAFSVYDRKQLSALTIL